MMRHLLAALGGLVLGYAAIAYLALPDLWRRKERGAALDEAPRVTRTADGIPGDPINVALIGSDAELGGAFAAAGWRRAAALGLRSDLRIGESVLLDRPDPNAPVSSLFLWGRMQDDAFEQQVGHSADQRHHVRFWRDAEPLDGRTLWLGAATFDRGVGVSHRTGEITHHIAPDIDAERDHVMASLIAAGQLIRRFDVAGVGPTLDGRNGGGDRYFTDGELAIGAIAPGNTVSRQPPATEPSPPAVAVRSWFFAGARPLLSGASD